MDQAFITDLYRRKESKSRKTSTRLGKVFIRTDEGLVSKPIVRKGDHDFGTFMGNVGSMRRSRKGRTYHAPNGKRFYVATEETVVAYKA